MLFKIGRAMTSSAPGLLTIGDLSGRTGVASATLRSWEARYGFPRPTRLAGGHRRYTDADAAGVLEVLRHRDSGFALETAVRLATSGTERPRSVHAALRHRFPELAPQVLRKPSLVALSHAIEDECCARAEQPLLFGAFQRERFLRQSWSRWVELARTARATVVFSDSAAGLEARAGQPVQVDLPPEAALNREWVLVCDAPDLPACLAAVERPGQEELPDAQRRFEAVWSVDHRVVRHASRTAAALADEVRPDWRSTELPELDQEAPAASSDLGRATGLLNRMMGYFDAHG
jgi:DICT domain-containing protein